MLIGMLPTYEVAGMWGAILLITLRIAQGLGAGAEQAGATVLISEFAPRKRRGFFASLPFVGIQIGTLLGAGALVPPGKHLEGGYLWVGAPVRKLRPLTEQDREYLAYVAANYVGLARSHRDGDTLGEVVERR